ncbi:unnamed protein product [Vicia faba]|uniref:Reverse transcriptase zinc-binding domain-containing protein n=1 Tax=Vicia faba TaxID=3906 RepID=A0AAV0ZLX1_VICFA|nr:unnamed protein product [Vicia faba]
MLFGDLDKKQWAKFVWERSNIPKHRFIFRLAIQNRVKIRDRPKKIGIVDNTEFMLYGDQEETTQHIFFDCKYNARCLNLVKSWLNWNAQIINLQDVLRWLDRAKIKRFKRSVYTPTIAAMVYHIWMYQNDVLRNSKLQIPKKTV